MKRLIFIAVAAVLAVGGIAPVSAAGATGPVRTAEPAPVESVVWGECDGLMAGRADCAQIPVPLDYRKPAGRKIHIGISRYRHTDTADYQGVLFVNPGGPSASGLLNSLAMASWLSGRGHGDVAAKYDMIGFDPRGVRTIDFNPQGVSGGPTPNAAGGTEPVLNCDPNYRNPIGPDYVPSSAEEERAWLARSKKYAADCESKFGWLLPYMGTANHAHDVDVIRQALGMEKISFYGFSHGTYFGAAYATLFPGHVKRMVLDANVNPKTVGYDALIEQDKAFERNVRFWFRWVAEYDSIYHLGRTEKEVEETYYRVRAEAKTSPIGGMVGPSELDDMVLVTGLTTSLYIGWAQALSQWVVGKDPSAIVANVDPGGDDSAFAVYAAAAAADVKWPRDWKKWRNDAAKLHEQGYRSITWANVWHHAPINFWPSQGGSAIKLKDTGVPGILLVHATLDGAAPVAGAYEMHKTFRSSRLLLEVGGKSHANSLNGNECIDGTIAAYLDNGSLPTSKPGADAWCLADPAFNDPDPTAPQPELEDPAMARKVSPFGRP